MPLLTPSEKSALEMMLRNKLGSGVGTSVMLKLFDHISESYVEPTPEVTSEVTPEGEPTTPVSTVEVTESSP